MRLNGRKGNELRAVSITPHVNKYAEGSVLITFGDTHVLCNASIEEKVPSFLKGQGKGWVTAEYAMLPRATHSRNHREAAKGKLSGRTMEIQRLIGRALRSVVKLDQLGERSITLDCDVVQADGGTRTTSITGAFVAMIIAMNKLVIDGKLPRIPVTDHLASISAGIIDDEPRVDLCYEEDSRAKVDMNVVMTGSGALVEIQGTGEESPFTRDELDQLLKLAEQGIQQLVDIQIMTLAGLGIQLGD